MPCLFIKFSQTFLKEMRGYQFGEFVCGYWDLQGNKNYATCLTTLLQNELNKDVTRFTTHIKPVLQ